MKLAERIERVLHFAGEPSDFCPENLEADVRAIKNRYSELKRVIDFESASRQARTEWLEKTIAEDLKRYVIIGMANDLQDDY